MKMSFKKNKDDVFTINLPESDLIFTKRFDIPAPPVNPVNYSPQTIYTSSLKPKTKFY
jgi:hypothetical protein